MRRYYHGFKDKGLINAFVGTRPKKKPKLLHGINLESDRH